MIHLQKIYIDLKRIVYLTLCLKHPTKICLKKVEQAQELILIFKISICCVDVYYVSTFLSDLYILSVLESL